MKLRKSVFGLLASVSLLGACGNGESTATEDAALYDDRDTILIG